MTTHSSNSAERLHWRRANYHSAYATPTTPDMERWLAEPQTGETYSVLLGGDGWSATVREGHSTVLLSAGPTREACVEACQTHYERRAERRAA